MSRQPVDRVRYKIRYQTLVHRVQHALVVFVGFEQNVLEMFQVEHVYTLKPGVTTVRIVDILFFGPLFHPVSERFQVRVPDQYLSETHAGRADRQIRRFQILERVDVGKVHWCAQERHHRTLPA